MKNLTPKEVFKKRGADLIRKVSDKDRYAIFLEPVDLDLVDGYSELIPRPMDLSTAQKNLNMGVYRTPAELRADLDLIWSNCCTFNADDSIYFREAVRLRALAARYYDDLVRLLVRDGLADAFELNNPTLTNKRPPRHRPSDQVATPIPTTPTPDTPDTDRRTKSRPTRARAAHDAAVAAAAAAATRLRDAQQAAGLPPTPIPTSSSATPSTSNPTSTAPPSTTPVTLSGPRRAIPTRLPPSLRARAAAVPEAWRRIGRWHGGTHTPFLSSQRANDVIAGRAFQRYVTRTAPIARRLLATVLDATVVQQHDAAGVGRAMELASVRGGEGSTRKRPRSREDGHSSQIPTAQPGATARLLRDALGEQRMAKAARRSDVLPEVSLAAPNKNAVSRLRSLLKQKGIDSGFVNALMAEDTPDVRTGGNASSGACGVVGSGNSGGVEMNVDGGDEKRRAHSQMGTLLNANFETMMNVLRLRALRETVPEAERENIEDRERECVESMARGMESAMRNVPPRLLVHPLDVAESALALTQGMASGERTSAK